MCERITDALRAECVGADLQAGPHGVRVMAMRSDGSMYELGHVSDALAYQNPEVAAAVISRIKFGGRPVAGGGVMKACVDCRHYTGVCEHPSNVGEEQDLVNGRVIRYPKDMTFDLRRSKSLCGPAGAWWEPRITLRQRVAVWAVRVLRAARGTYRRDSKE